MGVVERRLRAAEHGVDARDLPLAAREVRLRADLAPVIAGRMRGMDHLVVLLRRAVRELDQRPDVVEQIDRELAALLLRQRRARRGRGGRPWAGDRTPFPRSSYTNRGMAGRSGNGRCFPCDLEREQRAMSDVTAPSDVADLRGSATPSSRAPAAARAGRAVGLAAPHDVAHADRLRALGRLRLDRPRARAARAARGGRAGAVGSPPRAPRADRRAPRRAQPPPHLARALRRGARPRTPR